MLLELTKFYCFVDYFMHYQLLLYISLSSPQNWQPACEKFIPIRFSFHKNKFVFVTKIIYITHTLLSWFLNAPSTWNSKSHEMLLKVGSPLTFFNVSN